MSYTHHLLKKATITKYSTYHIYADNVYEEPMTEYMSNGVRRDTMTMEKHETHKI